MNVPGAKLSLKPLTPKDNDDLQWMVSCELAARQRDSNFASVDYVAMSFVKYADDLKWLKNVVASTLLRRKVFTIAKIETPEALKDLHNIVAEADGVMVARGDLAVEIPMEQVPKVQRDIINLAHRTFGRGDVHRGDSIHEKGPKFVIVATQLIESMKEKAQPLRAEVADIHYAVRDGADAIMTSAETAQAVNPVPVIEKMASIAREAETEDDRIYAPGRRSILAQASVTGIDSRYIALGEAACILAHNRASNAIVVSTYSGRGAKVVSGLRPRATIVAVTTRRETVYNLLAFSGVCPVLVEAGGGRPLTVEEYVTFMQELLREIGLERGLEEVVGFFGLDFEKPPTGPETTSNTIRLFDLQ